MKRILFVSYAFPPELVPESVLVTRTLGALVEHGWAVTVLTVGGKVEGLTDEGLAREISEAVEVIRVPSRERYVRVLGELPMRLHRIPFRALSILGWPEEQYLWVAPAVREGIRLMEERRFDVLYSRACFHTSNVVGYELRKAIGIPWIAHFSDPWVDNPILPTTGLRRRVCERLERAILEEADAAVFTTRQAVDLVMKKYPQNWRHRIQVQPHGYVDQDTLPVPTQPRRVMQMIYAGNFYRGLRTPIPVFEALRLLKQKIPKLDDIRVTLVGPNVHEYVEAAYRLEVVELVEFLGAVPFRKSQELAALADVLLLIDAPSLEPSVFLPSKLVDYLALKKPILGVTPTDGASADLLREIGEPIVDPGDIGGIAQAISDLRDRWRSSTLGVTPEFIQAARRYHIRNTTRELSDLLDQVIAQRRVFW